MNTGIPIRLAAQQLGKHRSTLSKWLKAGAPCVEEGSDGRGHGAIVNIDDLLRWKAGKFAPGLAQQNDDGILHMMETALLDALRRDDLARRAKITDMQAALIVLLCYERLHRNVKQEPLQPAAVPAQMRQLCTDYLCSVERATSQRR